MASTPDDDSVLLVDNQPESIQRNLLNGRRRGQVKQPCGQLLMAKTVLYVINVGRIIGSGAVLRILIYLYSPMRHVF